MDGAYVAIKGFKYQFDRTIIEIFDNPSKPIRIEQLQDYEFDNYYVQVKYHDTTYTAPQQKQKIKKPLLQLLNQHKADTSRKLILYIYLKGVSSQIKHLSLSDLEAILGNKSGDYTIPEKKSFANNFLLIHAPDFKSQHKDVIEKIRTEYSKSNQEAQLYYSIISSYLLDVVINNKSLSINLRTCSKSELDKLISEGKKIVFKSAFNDELKVDKQIKLLHNQFFKGVLNKEPHERIFVVEVDKLTNISVLKDLILTLKNKWSKNKTIAIPTSDRFVPYVLLQGIDPDKLIELKVDLRRDGHKLCDGYDFYNAPFDLSSIKEKPTFENKLFFKFINSESELIQIINNLDRTGEIYQFYLEAPLNISFAQKHLKFQVEKVDDIKNII